MLCNGPVKMKNSNILWILVVWAFPPPPSLSKESETKHIDAAVLFLKGKQTDPCGFLNDGGQVCRQFYVVSDSAVLKSQWEMCLVWHSKAEIL